MSTSVRQRPSYWTATAPETDFPVLAGEVDVDVAVVGAGIVGLTTARLLKDLGMRVAVVEALRVGQQATGRSTAKVTSQHNILYRRLIDDFGEDGARVYAEANEQAIGRIDEFRRDAAIACDFRRLPAYVYARSRENLGAIEQEVEAAQRLGLPAALETDPPLPFAVAGAIRFDDQAEFHPCKYLAGLAGTIPGEGSHVYENSRVTKVAADRVETSGGAVTARHVVVATHLPLGEIGLLFGRAFPYAHPMLAAPVDPRRVPEGMFISMESPTHSFRLHRDGAETRLIAVGDSYKPGHPDEEGQAFEDLEKFVRDSFGTGEIEHRWTNEEYRAEDGVPFIGRSPLGTRGVFVATGFNAWGITGGTVAGMIISDLIAERPNPWAALFDPARLKPLAGGATLLKENLSAARHLLEGWVSRRPTSAEALAPGEATILRLDGRRIAVHRDEHGELHAVSAVCSHLGCVLGWNRIDRTWDCPCHGSRFSHTGEVIHGPAVTDLKREQID